jgi:hypothetical protein
MYAARISYITDIDMYLPNNWASWEGLDSLLEPWSNFVNMFDSIPFSNSN